VKYLNEYTLSINSFNLPKVLDTKDATYTLLIRLILLEPGTFQSHPKMGVGIISRYRYSLYEDLEKLRNDISEQVTTYLPDLAATDIRVSEDSRVICIYITVDNILYTIKFDKITKTLMDL
jgi:hypothetical protein